MQRFPNLHVSFRDETFLFLIAYGEKMLSPYSQIGHLFGHSCFSLMMAFRNPQMLNWKIDAREKIDRVQLLKSADNWNVPLFHISLVLSCRNIGPILSCTLGLVITAATSGIDFHVLSQAAFYYICIIALHSHVCLEKIPLRDALVSTLKPGCSGIAAQNSKTLFADWSSN